jgi:hypothetical protein
MTGPWITLAVLMGLVLAMVSFDFWTWLRNALQYLRFRLEWMRDEDDDVYENTFEEEDDVTSL